MDCSRYKLANVFFNWKAIGKLEICLRYGFYIHCSVTASKAFVTEFRENRGLDQLAPHYVKFKWCAQNEYTNQFLYNLLLIRANLN